MTYKEVVDKRIPRIRMPHWVTVNAYLRVPLLENGLSGPWAELYDDAIQTNVLHIKPGSQKVLTIYLEPESCWEAYTGPVSPFEADPENFAHRYLEA